MSSKAERDPGAKAVGVILGVQMGVGHRAELSSAPRLVPTYMSPGCRLHQVNKEKSHSECSVDPTKDLGLAHIDGSSSANVTQQTLPTAGPGPEVPWNLGC